MNFAPVEKRSQGSLFAFIDLLFLLVAFLVLVLFFLNTTKSEAEVRLEAARDKLATLEQKKSAVDVALAKVAPILERFALQRHKEVERRLALAAKDKRRKARATVKVSYRIEMDGTIVYRKRTYSLKQFKTRVVDELRKDSWIAFRAFAAPQTPFGTVVGFRRRLLKGSGEFDTYWDNVTKKK